MGYEVVEAQSFWDCVIAMQRDDSYQGDLMASLVEPRHQPFMHPRLQTHDVGTAPNSKKIFSPDVGGWRSDRRLVWQVVNRTLVELLCGTHAVQERAKRMRVAFDPGDRDQYPAASFRATAAMRAMDRSFRGALGWMYSSSAMI